MFELTMLPRIPHGLGMLWEHLTTADFDTLEESSAVFMRRTLRLSPSAKSRFIYIMADNIPMIEAIRLRVKGGKTPSYGEYISIWRGGPHGQDRN